LLFIFPIVASEFGFKNTIAAGCEEKLLVDFSDTVIFCELLNFSIKSPLFNFKLPASARETPDQALVTPSTLQKWWCAPFSWYGNFINKLAGSKTKTVFPLALIKLCEGRGRYPAANIFGAASVIKPVWRADVDLLPPIIRVLVS